MARTGLSFLTASPPRSPPTQTAVKPSAQAQEVFSGCFCGMGQALMGRGTAAGGLGAHCTNPQLCCSSATAFTQKPWQDQRLNCLKWHCQMPKTKLCPAEPVDAGAGSSYSPAHDGVAWPKIDCRVGTLKDPGHQPSKTKFTIPSMNGHSENLDQWVL